jgi:hypothetical protein
MHFQTVTPQNCITLVRVIFFIYSTTTTQNSIIPPHPSDFDTPQDILSDYSQQILTIEDVQVTEDLTIVKPTPLPTSLVNTGVEIRDHTIKDFISRPRVVAQGTIAAGGLNNDLVIDLKFPDALLTLEPIREKLKGFQFLRSDIIIKVNFTAPPTVSGSFFGIIAPDMTGAQLALRTRDLVSTSQFPNKIVNIAKMPSLEFTLPWVSPYTHRNLMTEEGSNGSFQLRRIFPSSGIIRYIVFASFDTNNVNFDLSQPTPAIPIFPPTTLTIDQRQMLDKISCFNSTQVEKFQKLCRNAGKEPKDSTTQKPPKDTPLIAPLHHPLEFPDNATLYQIQEEEKLKQEQLTAHQHAVMNGLAPFGGPVLQLADVVYDKVFTHSLDSTKLPSLTQQCSHIYNSFADFFSMVGRPRLTNTTATEKRKLVPMEANINYNEPNTSHSFGMNSNNFVKTDLGTYGSSEEELNFSHIISRPNYLTNFQISNSDTYRSVLAAIPMDGFAGDVPTSALTTSNISLTHQGFIMNLFDSWLASINLDIHVFATQFHSVKLRFVVAPGHYTSSITGLEIDDSNSTVINFGENSFHQVKFPEITNRLFLKNRFIASVAGSPNFSTLSSNTSLGTFFILTEIPLVLTNDVVSPLIYGMVQHYFEKARFAKPATIGLLPQSIVIPPITRLKAHSKSNVYSYSPVRNTTSVQTGGPSASNEDPPKDDHCAYSAGIGESITSLRQFCTQFTSPLYFSPDVVNRRFVTYNPFTPISLSSETSSSSADKLDYLLSPFAFTKGGRHARVYFPDGYSPSVTFFNSITEDTGGAARLDSSIYATPTGNDFRSQRLIPIYKILEGLADIHIPYYSNFNMVPNLPDSDFTPFESTSIRVVTPVGNSFAWSRACAEDFSAGWLVGLPPYIVNSGNINYAPFTLPNQG